MVAERNVNSEEKVRLEKIKEAKEKIRNGLADDPEVIEKTAEILAKKLNCPLK